MGRRPPRPNQGVSELLAGCLRISVADDGMTPARRDHWSWLRLDVIAAADTLAGRVAEHLCWVAPLRAVIAARVLLVVVMLAEIYCGENLVTLRLTKF